MDEIERAVLCELNPALDPAIRNAARAFCENLENSAEGWSLCLEKMFKTTVMEVAFYCLGVIQNVVLHKYLTLSETDRVKLRTGLMRYLDQVLLKQSATPTLLPIRNKYAQVLVLVFKHEYPSAWPQFFSELWAALGLAPGTAQNPAGVPLWLLVLQAIDQEVVARDVPRSTAELAHNAAIKDSMREHVIKEITGLWYAILVQFHAIERRDVVKSCLATMRPYISWIDIGLVVNDKFIPLFVQYLSVESYREHVLDCYHEIIAKGMDANVKLTLIEQLRITELIESLFGINDEELQCKLGELINGLGEEVLRCQETLGFTPAVNLALDHISRLCVRHLARTDVAAATVADLCTQWVACLRRLKRDGGYAQQHVTRLGELLRVLHQKWSEDDLLTTGLSASSANIQLHGELSDDELREWAEFKKELSKMFKNITQLEPELVAQYIIQLMPQLPDLIRKSSLNDGHKAQSELAGLLNMFYLMAEALQPEVLKNNVKFFMQVLATLTEHHVDQLTQRTVATQYFEIASRCSRLLASQPASPEHQQLIGAILAAFLSPQSGIRSPLASTRARHCYLFKNFVTNLLSHLGSFTAMIINNLKDLFQFDQTTLDYRLEDKLDLFEAVSKLVGSSQDVALQQQSLLYLVSPAIQRIEEIVAQQLYKQDPPNNPRHLILLANLIQSIGTFSKGFPSKQIQPPIAALWQSATQVVIKTYEQLPTHAEIFKQVIFFFHRMVECLGALLLPYLNLFVPLLLTHLQNVPQFGDFIMLVAQMNDTFEDKMCDVVSALYLPLCDRVTSALAHESQVTPGSEDERELNELKKTYYYFLSSVCEHKLLPVLVAPAHMPRFEQVLKLVLAGCTYWTEPTTQRRCFTILRLLSEKLGGTQPSSLQGFNAFILQHVIKACFEVPLSPRFNLDDGTSITVLTEIVTLQKSVQTVCGEEFTNFMLNVLLPELKMTPDTAVTYLNTLKSSAINDFRNYLRAFFKQNRGSS